MTSSFERLRARAAGETPTQGRTSGSVVPDYFDTIDNPNFRLGDIQQISIAQLHNFGGHTFKVIDNENFENLKASISNGGIKMPLLVRPHPSIPGDYEIIAGHRRKTAATAVGLYTVPCMVEALDNNEAVILMAETNIQRPDWLPSEKARTFKAHLEATRRLTQRAGRPSIADKENYGTKFHNSTAGAKSRDTAAASWHMSGKAFEQWIKLCDLLDPLLDMVDENRLNMKSGYQVAFMSREQQQVLLSVLVTYPSAKVTEAQAAEIRSVGTDLDTRRVEEILGLHTEEKVARATSFSLPALLLDARAKKYRKDEQLQQLIADVVNRYVVEHEN